MAHNMHSRNKIEPSSFIKEYCDLLSSKNIVSTLGFSELSRSEFLNLGTIIIESKIILSMGSCPVVSL